jgi:hypothetical protein
VAGRFPLFTDENVDGPIIRGLRQRGWDVQHATEEFGEKTKDIPLLEYATSLERVMVSTDKHLLHLAKQWIKEGRSFRPRRLRRDRRKRAHLHLPDRVPEAPAIALRCRPPFDSPRR